MQTHVLYLYLYNMLLFTLLLGSTFLFSFPLGPKCALCITILGPGTLFRLDRKEPVKPTLLLRSEHLGQLGRTAPYPLLAASQLVIFVDPALT